MPSISIEILGLSFEICDNRVPCLKKKTIEKIEKIPTLSNEKLPKLFEHKKRHG